MINDSVRRSTRDQEARMGCPRSIGARTRRARGFPVIASLLLAAGLCAWPSPAHARQATQQEVRGAVVEAGRPAPVQGAMVLLLDPQGFMHGRVLTARDGTFRLAAPRPGQYRIRVDRIGYAATYSETFALAAGQALQITVQTDYQPIDLPGLVAEGSRRCEVRPTRGAAAAVWDEARKALEAATWTAERGYYRFTSTRFVREIADDGRRVLSDLTTVRRDLAAQPFAALHPDTLARRGFMTEAGRDVHYAAPDAATLVSDPFLDTHCFELERREVEGERLIGLRFGPVPGRRLPDVTGTLWLGELTGRLRSIEYNYVNLPWLIDQRAAGGEIHLRGLPNGTWIVSEWRIRMPHIVEERDDAGRFRSHRVTGYRDEGGIVNLVAATSGEQVEWDSGLGQIAGVVTDSAGRPAAGVSVRIQGADFLAETDRSGRFTFEGVGAGVWAVAASSEALDRMGLAGAAGEVDVVRDGRHSVQLSLPSVREAALARCDASQASDTTTVLLGRVVDEGGRPVPRASLRATWRYRPPAENPLAEQLLTRLMAASLEADESGRFALCGFPLREEVRIVAVRGDQTSEHVDAAVQRASQIASVEVRMVAAPAQAAAAGAPAAPRTLSAEDTWLATKGYARRAGYALLHQTRRQFMQVRRDSLSAVLEQVPRIEALARADRTIEYRLHASNQWAVQTGSPDYCVLDFYLNGSKLQPRTLAQMGDYGGRTGAGAAAFDTPVLTMDRWLDLRLVTAIEVFDLPDMPAGTGLGCGGVFVWTHYLDSDEDPDFDGFLRGRVTGLSDEQLAAGVPVTVQPGALRAQLDRFGRFDFGALTAARYDVEIVVPDFGPWKTDTMIRAGSVVEVQLEVSTLRVDPAPDSAIALPGIEVVGAARIRLLEREGFYQRQRDGVGSFLTPEFIDAQKPQRTIDLLRLANGIDFDFEEPMYLGQPRVMTLAGKLAEARLGPRTCLPMIYVDGQSLQEGGDDRFKQKEFDLGSLPANQVIAVEVYRSAAGVPVRFTGQYAACGVIIIWTIASVPPGA
jgi:hypothetical protein